MNQLYTHSVLLSINFHDYHIILALPTETIQLTHVNYDIDVIAQFQHGTIPICNYREQIVYMNIFKGERPRHIAP